MTTEAERVAIIKAVALTHGYSNPNTASGDWWSHKAGPVVELFAEAAAAERAALLDELEAAVKGLPEVEDLEVGGWSRVRRNAVLAVLAEFSRRRP